MSISAFCFCLLLFSVYIYCDCTAPELDGAQCHVKWLAYTPLPLKWSVGIGDEQMYCCVHTWTKFVETRLRFNGVSDTRSTSMLRRNTVTSAVMRPVAARDAARAPVRPITELHCRAAFTDWITRGVTCSAMTNHWTFRPLDTLRHIDLDVFFAYISSFNSNFEHCISFTSCLL